MFEIEENNMVGFFGGDSSKAHFTCHLSIVDYPIRSDKRREAYKKIQDAFGEQKYFQFPTKDESKKSEARARCAAHSEEILRVTGVQTTVSEGFFL